MKQVTFIHAADLHLDSPMLGLRELPTTIFQRLQESSFQALKTIIDTAIGNNCDFVIFAGDLFDSETRSIKAQVFLRKELERLQRHGIEVFIVYGNHDFFSEKHTVVNMPSNTHIFPEHVDMKVFTTRDQTIVHLYGFSYNKRHVEDKKIEEYRLVPGADYHIGILHGNMEGNSDHGNYAPFQLKDLIEKNFHYWALGHIHKRNVVHKEPLIIYPGNIQGRNCKEKGMKGCYLVTLSEQQPQINFIETSDCIWDELTIDCEKAENFNDLFKLCEQQLSLVRAEGKGMLLYLKLVNLSWTGSNKLKNELLEGLQELERDMDSFVWPVDIEIDGGHSLGRDELEHQSEFFEELFKILDECKDVDKIISPLYEHPAARKHLTPLSEEEIKRLKMEAEKLLIQLLYQEN